MSTPTHVFGIRAENADSALLVRVLSHLLGRGLVICEVHAEREGSTMSIAVTVACEEQRAQRAERSLRRVIGVVSAVMARAETAEETTWSSVTVPDLER